MSSGITAWEAEEISRDRIERTVGAVTYVDLPLPPQGGKCWLLESKGIFVLEPGPGTLRTIACTHAGAGAIEVLDGIPDENGFFPDEAMAEPVGNDLEALKIWHARRGRCLYRANPVVMGSWLLDAGFIHGLTIRAQGGNLAATAIASIVWQQYKARVPIKPPKET
jgi:hypothetical protein